MRHLKAIVWAYAHTAGAGLALFAACSGGEADHGAAPRCGPRGTKLVCAPDGGRDASLETGTPDAGSDAATDVSQTPADGGMDADATSSDAAVDGGQRARTRWVVFESAFSVYAYDLLRSPPAAPIRLSSGIGSLHGQVWSPDGKHVLYMDEGRYLNVRDMDGAEPSAPRILGIDVDLGWGVPLWSGDSQTVAFLAKQPAHTLTLVDPSLATPTPRTLPTTANFRWAPAGNRLAYVQGGSGLAVVPVSRGVPGAPQFLPTASIPFQTLPVWSPSGGYLAHKTAGSAFELLDVRGANPVSMRHIPNNVTGGTLDWAEFNAASTRVVFSGVQLRPGWTDLQYVAFDGSVAGPARRVHPELTREVIPGTWAPVGSWFSYIVRDSPGVQSVHAVDLSGTVAAPPVDVPLSGYVYTVWLPGSTKLLASNNFQMAVFDPAAPDTPPVLLDSVDAGPIHLGVGWYAINPRRSLVFYAASRMLKLVDLAAESPAPITLPIALEPRDLVEGSWSPDGAELYVRVEREPDGGGASVPSVYRVDDSGRVSPFLPEMQLFRLSFQP